jgi:hypothetical protein
MAFISTDNFDSYSDGNLTGNSGGTNWSSNWSTTGTGSWEPQVQASVILGGTKSVAMTPDAASDRGAARSFDAITSGVITVKVRRTSTSTGVMYIALMEGSSIRMKVEMYSTGYFTLNGTSRNNIETYSADITYTLYIEFDCSTDKARLKVDSGSYSSWFDFGAATTSIDGLRFMSSDATTGVVNYFDDIAPEITTNIKTVNGLAYASVKTVNDLAVASVKTVSGLA